MVSSIYRYKNHGDGIVSSSDATNNDRNDVDDNDDIEVAPPVGSGSMFKLFHQR